MLRKTDFYIDGKWVAPAAPREFEVINPADEQPFATISLGSKADVDKAVAAARRAFPAWAATSREERLAAIERLLEAYKARMADMAEAISREMGAPIRLATESQASVGAYHIKNFIRALKDFRFEHPLDARNPQEMIVREPGSTTQQVVNRRLREAGVRVRPVMEIGSRESIREAVACGLGLGVVSDVAYMPDPRLRMLDIVDFDAYSHSHVICLRERMRSRLVMSFLDVVDAMKAGAAGGSPDGGAAPLSACEERP